MDKQTIHIEGHWSYESVREMVAELRDAGFSVDAKPRDDARRAHWTIDAHRPLPAEPARENVRERFGDIANGRDVPFDESAICDNCGAKGALDFMGDLLCHDCASPKPEQEKGRITLNLKDAGRSKPFPVDDDDTQQQGPKCEKAPHDDDRGGYCHAEDDDGPYLIDGVEYCGRCHRWLPDCTGRQQGEKE